MKVAIVGSGAMGCRFGVALADGGADVWLYDVWQEHVDCINGSGLMVCEQDGQNRCLYLPATTDARQIPPLDIAFIFTKTNHTSDAIRQILPALKNETVIVTLQNGLGNIELIEEATGGNPIIAGVTNYASDLKEPGNVDLLGSGLTKMMGLSERAQQTALTIVQMLQSVGHNAQLCDDILVDIWEKVAFNAALNTTTSLTGLSVGDMGSLEESRQLLFDIASEVVTVAHAIGVAAQEQHVHEVIQSVFDPKMSGDHKTSMLQDRLCSRKTEIDSICGRTIALAKQHHIATPRLSCLYALVRVTEENYEKICF